MLHEIISQISRFLFLILHISTSNSFPKPLNTADEKKYTELKCEGDMEARRLLIEHNLRLVAHIVKKFCVSQSDQEDLISIGTIGLIKAVDTFDTKKCIRLATYASRCIENEILMYFRCYKKYSNEISLSEPIDEDTDGNPLSLMDILCVDDTIVDLIETKIKTQELLKVINEELPERERKIIILRYGLDNNIPKTQVEVGKMLSISRSYVSRIEKKVLEFLREKLKKFV